MIALIGRSNVGKSTLINALTGVKTAIVTPKPQTTRHIIHGVYDDERGQIVFVDTPGFFLRARDVLSHKLLERARFSMRDVDALVYVVDPTRAIGDEERRLFAIVRELDIPVVCAINKLDLSRDARVYSPDYQELCAGFHQTIEISALTLTHIKSLINTLFDLLPVGDALYPDAHIPRDDRHWASEIIREKIFHTFGDELPYGIHVVVDTIEDRGKILAIHASIITNVARHKGMIIGKGGRKLKEIGMSARKELELAAQKKIFLELSVKVDEHWMERYE